MPIVIMLAPTKMLGAKITRVDVITRRPGMLNLVTYLIFIFFLIQVFPPMLSPSISFHHFLCVDFYIKLPTSRITSHQKVAILCHLCCRLGFSRSFTRILSSNPPTKKSLKSETSLVSKFKMIIFQDRRILISRKTATSNESQKKT